MRDLRITSSASIFGHRRGGKNVASRGKPQVNRAHEFPDNRVGECTDDGKEI
jgi:hypothetical protein